MFTSEEKTFLLRILGNINIKPLESDALAIVQVIQSIFKKLTEEKLTEEKKDDLTH